MDHEPTKPQAPEGWLEDLDQAEAKADAGLAEDGAAVRQRLRRTIADMQAAHTAKDTPASGR